MHAIMHLPADLYAYVGLDFQGPYQQTKVIEALSVRLRNAFTSGQGEVRDICRKLQTDLIREHVLEETPLDPYFKILSQIKDAVRAPERSSTAVEGDWRLAIQSAQDLIEINNHGEIDHRLIYKREFAVADAAKLLREQGYEIQLEPGILALNWRAERSLIRKIEKLITQLGAVEVIAKIFEELAPLYDPQMGRYHLVLPMSGLGGGPPQVPWGYFLQLAVKHVNEKFPDGRRDFQTHWPLLLSLLTAYAAVVDVQPYYPPALTNFDAASLLKFFREQAVYDSMFRFLQLRSSDILKLSRGALSFLEFEASTPFGWTLDEAFMLIDYLIDPVRDRRGPLVVTESELSNALSNIPQEHLTTILRDVLAHPMEGPNQRFSHPLDAPTPDDKLKGADFYLRPLIPLGNGRYLIAERAVCGWGYIEALFSALRPNHKQFDDKVGVAIEGFIKAEFEFHGVPTMSGDYDLQGEHGECDLVLDTPDILILMEMKKKALTRRARAGVDVDLLLDLAGSLLAALAQAGWHELRIKSAGSLELASEGSSQTLPLDGRKIEKIAVGMTDFGSFQDRSMLAKFLESTLNANFGARESIYDKKFQSINSSLQEIRDQYTSNHQGETEVHQPFFNCWFMSIPQILAMLDGVADADGFKKTLWNCRHLTTGTSDLYFEISKMRRLGLSA